MNPDNIKLLIETLVTLVVGGATAYVAIKQYQLEKRQAKLEQRRAGVEIYERLESTMQAVSTLLNQTTKDEIPPEAITEFAKAIRRATPLLDDKNMIEYLNQLRFHASYLRLQQQRLARSTLTDEERDMIHAEIDNTLKYLNKQQHEHISRFRDYLSR